MRRAARLSIALSTLVVACSTEAAPTPDSSQLSTPQAAVDELISADRAFSTAAEEGYTAAMTTMFTSDVAMRMSSGQFSTSASEAIADLNKENLDTLAHATWTPIRAGIAADGQHGFTFGYMSVHRTADDSVIPMKYISYWVKGADGWHVAVHNHRRRPAGDVPTDLLTPALPGALQQPVTDEAAIEAFRTSVMNAERAFSNEAQTIGLGPAFVKFGGPDAINMGGRNDTAFVMGPAAIGRLVAEGEPATGSSVRWEPVRALAASSGDLGITIGNIHVNAPPPPGQQPRVFPFFTIWRRDGPAGTWRYVAE